MKVVYNKKMTVVEAPTKFTIIYAAKVSVLPVLEEGETISVAYEGFALELYMRNGKLKAYKRDDLTNYVSDILDLFVLEGAWTADRIRNNAVAVSKEIIGKNN